MNEDPKHGINVDVGLSAKAEIKGEIPTSSMGRLVDALTDAIRPFTESRGLKADQIRLQREDVLIEIAMKARQRLELLDVSAKPIPNRVLVPLLENASLSDAESETLKSAWANLLVSASRGEERNIGIFSDTLSKLDPIHVRFLEDFGRNFGAFPEDSFLNLDSEAVSEIITEQYFKVASSPIGEDKANAISDALATQFRRSGAAIVSGFYDVYEIENRYPNAIFSADVYYALEALSIIVVEKTKGDFKYGADAVWLKTIRFTPYGFEFYKALSNNSPHSEFK